MVKLLLVPSFGYLDFRLEVVGACGAAHALGLSSQGCTSLSTPSRYRAVDSQRNYSYTGMKCGVSAHAVIFAAFLPLWVCGTTLVLLLPAGNPPTDRDMWWRCGLPASLMSSMDDLKSHHRRNYHGWPLKFMRS
jgi:hypothetical protein